MQFCWSGIVLKSFYQILLTWWKTFKGTGTIEEVDEDDDITKEITTFDHICKKCEHNISKHTHEFWIEDGYQEYRMECLICGLGEDSISILPKDPRK